MTLSVDGVERLNVREKTLRDSWMAEHVYKPYGGHWGHYAKAALMARACWVEGSEGFIDFWSIVKRLTASSFCKALPNILELLADYMELPIDSPWDVLKGGEIVDLSPFPQQFKESVKCLVHKATKYQKFSSRILALCSCIPNGPLPMELCKVLIEHSGIEAKAVCQFVVSQNK
eukprot:gnl/Chilomastix_caulleri/1478.p1 GENE.gnl/Chilomastix_caulleri/1478~~gnl/Chilomastix_caulleri/1478.p1  ORF type:complete len:174 (+),score=32.76 gnl/Chilomastix_caulleri/1478:338-859(+)